MIQNISIHPGWRTSRLGFKRNKTSQIQTGGDMWFFTTPSNESGPCKGPPIGKRYLLSTLNGCVEFETCDVDKKGTGVKMIVRPGDMILMEDNLGPAHQWRIV